MIGVLIGAVSGFAGGAAALRLADDETAPAAPAVSTQPATTDDGEEPRRLEAAIERVLPAVVTVLADLPPVPQGNGTVLERQNLGSGIVVDDEGWVITNYHVVEGAAEIRVALSTGEQRPAQLVADDSPFRDLAVLRIPGGGLREAAMGDSGALSLGERVVAVSGGLVTFDNQVKAGVVSALGVPFPRDGVILEDMLQTDAAVNHGDSGGALVNLDGEVVGLLTTVVRSTPNGQTVEGVALAHSSNSIRETVEAVLATGANPRLRYGIERLGEQHVPVTPARAEEEGLSVSSGALIIGVAPGSPAEEAGVQVGDVVVEVNGSLVAAERPLVNLLAAVPQGGSAQLGIVRGESQVALEVTPRPAARREATNG